MTAKRDEEKNSGSESLSSSNNKNGSKRRDEVPAGRPEDSPVDSASSESPKSQPKKSKKLVRGASPKSPAADSARSDISEDSVAESALVTEGVTSSKPPTVAEPSATTGSASSPEASKLQESSSPESSTPESSSPEFPSSEESVSPTEFASDAPAQELRSAASVTSDSTAATKATGSDSEAREKSEASPSQPVSEIASDTASHLHGKIYSDVLEKSIPVLESPTYRHPLFIDALLAAGLLVAVGGITLGLVKFYITQEAKLDISQRRYSQAISVLQGAPLPGWFAMKSEQEDSPEELLNQAYYLDAMEKLDTNKSDVSAIKELEKIEPGSRFYKMANEILDISAPRSAITLEGNVEHQASATEANSPEAKPLVPEAEESK